MAWSSPDGRGDEMRPLVASLDDSEHDVAANSGTSSSQPQQPQQPLPPPPPPPVSGHVPSPSSGIHAHRLRHRHQMMVPPPISTPPPPRRHQQQQQLDDADAAAGARAEAPRTASAYQRAATQPGDASSSPAKNRSFSHPVHANSSGTSSSSPFLSSRSLGSRTPDNQKRHFHSPSLSYDDHMQQWNERHSEEFFNNVGRSPPRTQRMERGLRRGATYGGSEHDFLTLTSRSSMVVDDGSASSGGSYSQNDNMMARKRHPHHHHHNQGRGSPRRMHAASIPPLPPLEITTQRGTSCPPYGLPTIEGSPAPAELERKMAQMSLSEASAAGTVPPPPVSPLTPEEGDSGARFVVLGWDMSSYARRSQFLLSAGGTFGFSLLYGYLQELISVELCGRKLGLFLALTQFTGYTILSYFFRKLDRGVDVRPLPRPAAGDLSLSRKLRRWKNWGRLRGKLSDPTSAAAPPGGGTLTVPMELYVGLSILRAIDLGMTNLAMQYVNYPAKTLMKSTRVVFTMIFGVIVTKKRYGVGDYGIVGLMVAGLGMFMRADAKTSAVFNPLGIMMLTISLLCDGAISNLSEALMNRYSVGQDEFIFRLYSIATFFICLAAAAKGDLRDGVAYLTSPGTLHEMEEGLDPTWSIMGKILTMVLFSTTGFLSSSCSAAITKSFGALTMSITSTARKATTIFLSFALFPNECTLEHVGGIFLFITSLVAKSLRASRRGRHHHHHHHNGHGRHNQKSAAEIGGGSLDASNDALLSSPLHLRRKVPGDEVV